MSTDVPIFTGAFPAGASDIESRDGAQPVIFDILGPDRETSVLPDGYRLVLHVNPNTFKISYSKKIERLQTKTGWVEQHWGDDAQTLNIDASTGTFMRLYSGLSNVTGTSQGGSRRETLAYDAYLDWLALFHSNGSIYDDTGQIAFQGIIEVTFSGGVYRGWFNSFTVTESADTPYAFQLSCTLEIAEEVQVWRSTYGGEESPYEGYVDIEGGGSAAIIAAPNTTRLQQAGEAGNRVYGSSAGGTQTSGGAGSPGDRGDPQ